MAISITLQKTVTETAKGTIKLHLQCTATDISSKVFAIEVLPGSADQTNKVYRFSHICSPAELVEFPEDEPFDNCYFRTDDIELIFDTNKIIDHVILNIEHDIQHLVSEYKALESGVPGTESQTFS